MTRRLKLGEVLLAEGVISEFQLSAALGEQARWGNRLGETLVHMGFLGEQELVRALSRRFELAGVDLEGKTVAPEVLARVPRDIAETFGCLPLFVQREQGLDVLYLGMDDPTNLAVVDDVSFRTGLRVRPVVAGPLQLRRAIAAHYRGSAPTPSFARTRATLAEAVLPPDDTAPLLPGGVRPVLEPPPKAREPASPPVRPAPSGGAQGQDSAAREGEAPTAADLARPRQVPTRDILRALVHLLIDRDVITREELMRAVQALAGSEEPDEGPSGR